MSRRLLWTLSVAAGAGYLWHPHVGVKGLAVSVLAVLAIGARRGLLALALALSSLGDVLLALGRGWFLHGLVAFLAAHLVYITLFTRMRAASRPWLVPAALALYGIAIGAWLSPNLGPLRWPVFGYISAIIVMTATAYRAGSRSRHVFAGALLFLLSDSLLATGRFLLPLPYGGVLVWITYYVGQFLITWGVIRNSAPPNPDEPNL